MTVQNETTKQGGVVRASLGSALIVSALFTLSMPGNSESIDKALPSAADEQAQLTVAIIQLAQQSRY